MINVTKTFLPPFDEYIGMLKRVWANEWITNNGELVQELEQQLKNYLQLDNLLFTGNGTVVLQMALKALNITKDVITTPFSYVATVNAILWEGCKPVFVDINRDTFCIDAEQIEAAITKDTQAILATHVYGYPCDVEAIKLIADKYNIKIIYDGAHAFGCKLNNRSLLSYGDISTCSFHATKVFHTVEGGCVICNNDELFKTLSLFRSFGHIADNYYSIGINGKNSEFHAAMGLVNLKHLHQIITQRKYVSNLYNEALSGVNVRCLSSQVDLEYNYAYYPVLFESEITLLNVVKSLKAVNIIPRRYFYPSLNTLPQTVHFNYNCPVSEDISKRILCLPLYPYLPTEDIDLIIRLIKTCVQ